MFAPKFFAPRYFAPRYYLPDVLAQVALLVNAVVALALAVAKSKTSPNDLSSMEDVLFIGGLEGRTELTPGRLDNQVDVTFHDRRTVSASSNDDLQLAGRSPVLTGPLGHTINIDRLRVLYLRNQDDTNAVTVGPAPTKGFDAWINGTTPSINLRPGGAMLLTAPIGDGFQPVNDTSDVLRVANAAGADVDYDILLLGAEP